MRALLIASLLSLCSMAHAGYYYLATQTITYGIDGTYVGGFSSCQAACSTWAPPVNGAWNWCPQHVPVGPGNGQYTGTCSMAGANCQTFYHWTGHPDQSVAAPCISATRWSCPDGSTPNASHQCWSATPNPQCLLNKQNAEGKCSNWGMGGGLVCTIVAAFVKAPEIPIACAAGVVGYYAYCMDQAPDC
jgi:hypothetical protein